MAYDSGIDLLYRVRVSDIHYGWNHLPGHPQAAHVVVSWDLVGDQPEDRRQCPGGSTDSGIG